MKLEFPPRFIPYGPVGHPEAHCFTSFIRTDKEGLSGQFHQYLENFSRQNIVPTTFFDETKSLAENGYHLLRFERDEVSDEEIAALPSVLIFTPAGPGTPGRKLDALRQYLPRYYRDTAPVVWAEGEAGCDHDFGLETYAVMFEEDWTGQRFKSEEMYGDNFDRQGSYFGTVKCTRCGAWHALQEPPAR